MATAAPTVSSTKETTNYARLCRLLVDAGTQALRDIFDAIHPPANLHTVLTGNKTKLQSLRTRKIINATQWGKLFPVIPSSVSSRDFDITLLMVLLRNICCLSSPVGGWDTLPAVTDVSREADIARVKYYRNNVYGHAECASVDASTFNACWSDIRDTLVRLGGAKYKAAIDNLEVECMDPEVEEHYKKLLSQWKKDEDNLKDKLDEIGSGIETVMKKLDDLKSPTLTPKMQLDNEGMKELKVEEAGGTNRPGFCEERYHENEPLQFYCRECEICICHRSKLIPHFNHTSVKIQQVAEEQKAQMFDVLHCLKTEIGVCENRTKRLSDLWNIVRHDISTARICVQKTAEDVIRVVREHEKAVLEDLDKIEEEQDKSHALQQERYQLFSAQLKGYAEHCENILRRNNSIEILQTHQTVVERCKSLLNTHLNVCMPSHVSYLSNDEAVQKIMQTILGQVIVSSANSLKSVAEGIGLECAEVGRKGDFAITTKDFEGKVCYYKNDAVTVNIKTPLGEDLDKIITNKQDGKYIVTFTPTCTGKHHVTIAVNSQPLTGSPWGVQVYPHRYRHVLKFGSSGKGQGQIDDPFDIAVCDKTGKIAVADCQNNRIQLFTSDGQFLSEFGQKRFHEPFSVAFTRYGEVAVVHSGQISMFSEDFHFITHIINEQLKSPWALSITCDNQMVVCDNGDNSVKVLSPDGAKLIQCFSAPDCDEAPWFAIFHQDRFFASYDGLGCVKVFNKEGVFSYNIGMEGPRVRHLSGPFGLVVDKYKNLVVCDYESKHLQVFTLDGEYVHAEDQLNVTPWSIAMSKKGQLFITDPTENCVHVLE